MCLSLLLISWLTCSEASGGCWEIAWPTHCSDTAAPPWRFATIGYLLQSYLMAALVLWNRCSHVTRSPPISLDAAPGGVREMLKGLEGILGAEWQGTQPWIIPHLGDKEQEWWLPSLSWALGQRSTFPVKRWLICGGLWCKELPLSGQQGGRGGDSRQADVKKLHRFLAWLGGDVPNVFLSSSPPFLLRILSSLYPFYLSSSAEKSIFLQ